MSTRRVTILLMDDGQVNIDYSRGMLPFEILGAVESAEAIIRAAVITSHPYWKRAARERLNDEPLTNDTTDNTSNKT